MEIGIIGLGKMGGNMAERLEQRGHRVIGCDPSAEARARIERVGAEGVETFAEMVALFTESPRIIWCMVPAGQITENVLNEVAALLSPGDILIDGGNSKFSDSVRRQATFQEQGLRFLDVGTSGGIWGLQEGYCLMVGGDAETYQAVEPLLLSLAQEGGLLHVGPAGSGHYVKMVHNGIEYALMQSYAEGFEIMKASPYPDLDLKAICDLWMHGSVVRSWLLELAGNAFEKNPNLEGISDYVEDSGEGRWTVQTSIENGVPSPVIALSLYLRFRSRQEESFSGKVLAALRNEFGGHAVHRKKEE
jgi:6-phosphogluconate dehydrogenase